VSVTVAGQTFAGLDLAGSTSWTFTTAAPTQDGCPCSLFPPTATPAVAAADDTASVELGVRIVPQSDGVITGIRFYKGPGNGGTHVGSLWSAAGVRLAQVTFTGETATGWQTAYFATPVPVTAGQTYTASYLAPQGRYSATSDAFGSALTNGPLTAPATTNGVYRYGGGFPSSSFRSTNYWVDVLYQRS
jgi:hypothetical protein